MNYKPIINGVVGQLPYTPMKCIPFLAAIPAIMSAAQAIYNGVSTVRNNKRNIENQNMLWQEQKAQQQMLNATGALVKRQSMERAGLNPMADFGYSPNLTASTPTPAQQTAPQFDLSPLMALIQQAPVVQADARQKNADAKRQEIENARMASEDAMLYNLDILSNVPEGATPGDIPELKVAPFNAGTLQALRNYTQYKGEKSDFERSTVQNALASLVATKQIDNPEVMDKLVRLPVAEFNKIWNEALNVAQNTITSKSQAALFDSQESLNRLEERMTKDSNLHALIDKYLGDSVLADVCHGLIVLIGAVTGNMKISGTFSKFSGKTSNTNNNTSRSTSTNNNTSNSTVHHYSHRSK